MKRILILLAPLLWVGNALATQDPPEHIRVSIQYFSLPLSTLSELLADEQGGDSNLRDKVIALTNEGKARLLDTQMTVCRSGEKSVIESIREEIYPTEYSGGCTLFTSQIHDSLFKPTPEIGRPFDAAFKSTFETRNTGAILEVEATAESFDLVSLRLVPEFVAQNGFTTSMEHTDRWGNADIKFPFFETWRTNTNLLLKSGRFALVSSITPKRPLPAPFEETRILLFVRADVLGSVLD